MREVLCTLDVHQLMRAPVYDAAVRSDFHRARRFLEGTWPEPLPPVADFTEVLMDACPYVVIDTEYQYEPKENRAWDRATRLDLIGVYGPSQPAVQFEWYKEGVDRQASFTEWLRHVVSHGTVVMQNTSADVLVLDKWLGIKYEDYRQIEDTMYAHACRWAEHPHDLEYLESIYGRRRKAKHLARIDPLRYNLGDLASTADAWDALSVELDRDPLSRAVYYDMLLPLRPVVMDSEKRGIRVDKERVASLKVMLQEKADFARLVVEAYAGFPANPNSSDQLVALLKEDKLKINSLAADKLVTARGEFLTVDPREDLTPAALMERIEDGGHALLEARAAFIQADKQLGAYINPLLMEDGAVQDRVYPHFLPTAQDNGRWSTTNPPLAQIPVSLRDIITADEGWPWLGWDWSAIELRILAAMAHDDMLLAAFENDWDLHVIHCCEIFGYPLPTNLADPHSSDEDAGWRATHSWQGKDDKRRVFAKGFVYRLIYGGDPRNAHTLPGANKLGMAKEELISGSYRWLSKHPGLTELWREIKEATLSRGEVRDWHGRRRVLTEREPNRRMRQALDMPMQSGCSMVFNETIIRIAQEMPDARFVYGCHDSQYWALPERKYDDYMPRIMAIADRDWTIRGVTIRLACDFHDFREDH